MVSEAQRSRAPIQKLADSDPIKKTTPGAIKALHELGLKVIMATGAGWDCQGDCAQPGCDEKYPPKSIFRLCLQRVRAALLAAPGGRRRRLWAPQALPVTPQL